MGWLLVAAPLWSAAGVPQAPDSLLGPLSTLPATDGPAVVVRQQPGVPLVAVRLSVPVEEPPGSVGATRVLQHLAQNEVAAEAARYGARLEFERSPAHAVYRAVGPARSFEALVSLLRRAVDAPDHTGGRLRAARIAVQTDALAALETPARLVRERLKTLLFPASLAPARTPATASLTPARLQAFWSRYFQPERMHAVVVGDVSVESVASSFRGWPAPAAADPIGPADSSTVVPIAEAQVLFHWAAVGYPVGRTDAATLAVVAELLETRLPGLGLRNARAEVWWGAGRRALVVVAAAPPPGRDRTSAAPPPGRGSTPPAAPQAGAGSLSQRLRTFVAETAALLEPARVIEARRAVGREILFAARTPLGFAELVGSFLDRTGEPTGAAHFLDGLDEVGITGVRAAMLDLLLAKPAVVEIRP